MTWFNQPWITKTLKEGAQIVLAGKVEQYLGRHVMNNPEWELLDEKNLHTSRILPVYPLTAKISQRWLRTQMDKVVNYWALRVQDPLPEIIQEEADLLSLPDALLQIHFPDSYDALKAAQHRLAFDEIFYLQLGVVQQKRQWAERTATPFHVEDGWKAGPVCPPALYPDGCPAKRAGRHLQRPGQRPPDEPPDPGGCWLRQDGCGSLGDRCGAAGRRTGRGDGPDQHPGRTALTPPSANC